MYLLDTNGCLDFVLARSDALKERVRQSYRKGLAISSITLAELRVGAQSSTADPLDDERLDRFVGTLQLHDFDRSAALAYGVLVRQIGIKRTSFDRLIAAHALALGLTLVTNNERDFADVPGLVFENWAR
ncbi:MAG: type II toxin-antitoxin system VapC family toxin [Sphingomonas sp.]|nr:type II toxin-antitoxin system VapC family toxin [Sphingomonas sp.]